MPNMASVTVKAADGVQNIIFDALSPAGGDGSKAVWRTDTGVPAGVPQGHRATVEMRTTWNGPRTARRAEITFKNPYTTLDTTTSRYSMTDMVVGSATFTLPQGIPQGQIADSVHTFCNFLAAALIKSAVESGYAPT